MTDDRGAPRLCRVLLTVAALAAVWGWAIAVTGGFVLNVGPVRVSSRNIHNPLLLALVAITAAWILGPRGRRRHTLMTEWRRLAAVLETAIARMAVRRARWLAPSAAALIAVAVVAFGIQRGAFVAGAADPYGYVSQAHLWLTGTLRVELPQVGELPEGISPDVLVPLGYRLAPDGASLVPGYSPGFPLLMAVFERLGGPDVMFYVMPLLAGVAVWATYVLGRMVAGNATGVTAALLLATTPAFLLQLTHAPMSDIPAMAWWTMVLVLLPRPSRISALLAGLAAGAAILTRPNLVPLAIVPCALLVWNTVRPRPTSTVAAHRLVLFGLGSVPACLAVGYLNDLWYGSPLTSGYGTLAGVFYRWEHFGPNVAQYSTWMADSNTPLVFAAAAAPVLLWKRHPGEQGQAQARSELVAHAAFVAGTCLCYLFYFPLDTWWSLRLLFPAFPIIFVWLSVVILAAAARLPKEDRRLATLLLVGAVTAHAVAYGRANSALDSTGERRYETVGRHIAQRLPERAVLFAMLHGGSARYYSGRLTVRWDLIPPLLLEPAIAHFQKLGYAPFLLLDENEERQFVARFSGATPLAALDWTPVEALDSVRIFDVSHRPVAQEPPNGQLR